MDLRNLLQSIGFKLPEEPLREEIFDSLSGPGDRDLTLQNIGKFISLMEGEQGKNIKNKSKYPYINPILAANSFLRTRYPQFAGRVPIEMIDSPSISLQGSYTPRSSIPNPYIEVSADLSIDPAVAAMSHEMGHADQDFRGELPPRGRILQPGSTKESFQAYLNQPHEVGARRQSDLAAQSWKVFRDLIERAPATERERYYNLLRYKGE